MPLLNQLRRTIYSPRGQQLAMRSKRLIKPLVLALGMTRYPGKQVFDPQRPTVVVVSHEASATGAPILALNIAQRLSKDVNVIVMLPRGGALIPDFQQCALAVLQARLNVVFKALLQRELRRLLPSGHWPSYALVNSLVSAGFVEPLRSSAIAPITLIHEFSAYIRPLELLDDVALWSSRLIFSSPLTRQDIFQRRSSLQNCPMAVLPQGPCVRPERPGRQNSSSSESLRPGADAEALLEELSDQAILLIGAGEIQPRKGVDLFIAVADQLRALCPGKILQFAWIGSGYDPLYDFSVSLWLSDQIHRSGLQGQLHMLDHSNAYGALLERADLFLMTSRLDPLPNVAIDALLAAKPVLCFEKACGIADLLNTDAQLGPNLVAPYLDVTGLARRAAELVNQPELRRVLAQHGQSRARDWFNMTSYITQLRLLGEQAAAELTELQHSLQSLLAHQAIDPGFGYKSSLLPPRQGIELYLLAWRSGVWPRKPFAGFHPGIYRQVQLNGALGPDPLLHYLEAGRPTGPWCPPLITPNQPSPNLDECPTGLHIHVHYPELLGELLDALADNRLRPHLYLSVSEQVSHSGVEQLVSAKGFELHALQRVPNRGRDIGPLLSCFGQTLDARYEVHGHLHTKKSVLIGSQQAASWRQFLLAHLVGDRRTTMADRCVAALQANPSLGLVFADDPTCVGWQGNRAAAEPLAQRLRLGPLPEAFDFPVGTMFWARRGALKPLYELGLDWSDYPPEPLGYDGTMLHALERLLPMISQAQGYGYALSHVPGVVR